MWFRFWAMESTAAPTGGGSLDSPAALSSTTSPAVSSPAVDSDGFLVPATLFSVRVIAALLSAMNISPPATPIPATAAEDSTSQPVSSMNLDVLPAPSSSPPGVPNASSIDCASETLSTSSGRSTVSEAAASAVEDQASIIVLVMCFFMFVVYIFGSSLAGSYYRDAFNTSDDGKQTAIALPAHHNATTAWRFLARGAGAFFYGTLLLLLIMQLEACLSRRKLGRKLKRSWKEETILLAWLVFALYGAGAAAQHYWEKEGWSDSIYFSLVSNLTVGYGDLKFNSQQGMIFCACWLPVSSVATAEFLGRLSEVLLDSLHRAVSKMFIKKRRRFADILSTDYRNNIDHIRGWRR